MTAPVHAPAVPLASWTGVRVAAGIAAGWVLVGIVMGAQASLGAALSGGEATSLTESITYALVQTIPWIPVSLAVVWLTNRFPIGRGRWRRAIAIHLIAAAVLAIVANALVVLGYWIVAGEYKSPAVLLRDGVKWATLRWHVAMLIYAAVLAITETVGYYRRTQHGQLQLARLESQLARARLQALNAQMRPHFLFNTLHTIGQLWRSGKSDDAEVALDHLGNLFHKVHRSTLEFEVPLADELAMVREYLAIEQARFRDRLVPEIRVGDGTLEWMVPPLILQPLVENAVRHGISAASTAGRLEVTAAIDGDRLRLEVRDDGPGMAATTTQPGSGTGLANTRERLAQLYGAEATLEIAASGSDTVVTVTIPRRARR